ncbi:hypothetical protein J2129_002615 [Methanofollis sp. W23]|nr:hypothetical protein [Methanofollis sp. W23]
METTPIEFEPILGICEAVVQIPPFEPWMPGVLPCLHPPEVCFEGKIYAHLNVLENLRMNLIQIRSFLFPLRQDLVRLIKRDGTLFLFLGVLPQCERIVIDPSAYLKRLLKERNLKL